MKLFDWCLTSTLAVFQLYRGVDDKESVLICNWNKEPGKL